MSLAFEDADQFVVLDATSSPDDGLVPVDSEDLQGAHDDSEKIDELISTTRALEEITQAVQAARDQGGLGPQTAKALDVAFEHFKHHAGIPSEKSLSLEGFGGGRSSRTQSTSMALEDMGETVRRVIKKIIAWIKHIAQLCFDMIERIMRGANAVIEKSQSIYRAASAISYKRINPDNLTDITQAGLVGFFNKNGKPMDAHEIVKRFMTYCADVNEVFDAGKLFGPSVKALDALEHYVHQHGEKAVDLEAVEGFASEACEQLAKDSLSRFTAKHQDDADLLSMELPFGNSQLIFSFAHGHSDQTKRVGFHISIQTSPVDKAAALTPMRPQEVMNLMSVLTAEMSKGIYRESKKIKSAIHDVAKRVEKQSMELSDRQRHLGASVVPTLNLVKTISDSSMKLTRLMYAYSGITTRRLLSYSEASLRAYEKASIDKPA
jgi:hypothetical protein